MEPENRLSILILLLPMLLALVGIPSPQSLALQVDLAAAREALELHNRENAIEKLRRVVEYEPWRLETWEELGTLQMESNHWPEAISTFGEGAKIGSLSFTSQLALGQAYLMVGEDEEALRVWKQLLDTGYADSELYKQTIHLQRRRGDLPGAEYSLNSWLSIQPDNPPARFELGMILSITQPLKAIEMIRQAAEEDISFSASAAILQNTLNAALKAEPESYQQMLIGRTLGKLGQWDIARQAFIHATELSPGYAEAWAFLGEARQQLGEDGWQDLNKAQTLKPDSIMVRALLAIYWRRSGKPELGLEYLKTVAADEPDQPIWQVEIGTTIAEMGDIVKGLEYYQKAVLLTPQDPYFWIKLAEYCVRYNQDVRSTGLPAARQALILTPGDPVALDLMGQIMLVLQDFSSSERFLHQAIEKDTTFAPAYLHLGQLYLATGQNDQAFAQLTQASRLAGDQPMGILAKRLLQQQFGQ